MHLAAFLGQSLFEAKKLHRVRESLEKLARMTRLYPSPWWSKYAMFSMLLPLGLLIYSGDPTIDLAKALPLIAVISLGYTSTFLFNSLTDLGEDRFKPEPLHIGKGGLARAKVLCGSILITEIILALLVFDRTALVLFLLLQVLSLSYSWGIRFKETFLGPLVGSLFYWGPIPLIAAHIGGIESITIWNGPPSALGLYLICMIFMGMDKELSHNLFDYEIDKRAGLRTFGQRAGRRNTMMLVRGFKALYLCALVMVGYFISLPALIISIVFVLFGITGFFQSKYYFTVLIFLCIFPRTMEHSGLFLIFASIPYIVKFIIYFFYRLKAAFHRTRAALTCAIDQIHARHRASVFSELEKKR